METDTILIAGVSQPGMICEWQKIKHGFFLLLKTKQYLPSRFALCWPEGAGSVQTDRVSF